MKLLSQNEVMIYALYLSFGLSRSTAYACTVNVARQHVVEDLLKGVVV
jgi:hypothetical protein